RLGHPRDRALRGASQPGDHRAVHPALGPGPRREAAGCDVGDARLASGPARRAPRSGDGPVTDVDLAIPSASPAWSRLRDRYDRTPTLSDAELEAVRALAPSAPLRRWLRRPEAVVLERLVTPLVDAITALDIDYGPTVHWNADLVALELLRGCWRQRSAYWGWTTEVWVAELGA